MGIAILLAAALAWWLHKRGELLPNLLRLAGTGAAALVAMQLLKSGKLLPALVVGAAGAVWWLVQRPKAPVIADEAAARALLGVAPDADATAINAAWRDQIARVHPDRGGTAALAAQVTAARDLLLARKRP